MLHVPSSRNSNAHTQQPGRFRLLCPTCGKRFGRDAAEVPPFCSRRCKLLDLSNWLDESYRLPGDPAPDPGPESE